MGHVRNGPPADLVLALKTHLTIDEFVETGTHMGDTAAWAGSHFSKVTTIELSTSFHGSAQDRLQSQLHIRTLCGDSPTILSDIVPHLKEPTLFWLDAHWSGADTAGGEEQCPVLRELSVLERSPVEHVVLIDDARLFCAPPPAPQRFDKWPSLSTLVEALDAKRRYIVLYEDVFVAVPHSARQFLCSWLQDNFEGSRPRKRSGWWFRR